MKKMKTKNIICTVVFLTLSVGVLNAQGMLREGVVNDFSQVEILDKAVFSCRYEEFITMDSVRGGRKRSVMLLEVGDHVSKYFAERDSKDRRHEMVDKLDQHIIDSLRMHGYTKRSIIMFGNALFRNYRDKKLTIIDNLFRYLYRYDEDLEAPDWKLQGDTATVNGYLCRKATCSFRGRGYEAWYAPEIPVSEGPWKFYGLPGLILKVVDNSGYFSWECIAFKNEDRTIDIYADNMKVLKTSKAEFKKLMDAFIADPYGYMTAQGTRVGPATEGATLPVITVLSMELE